MAFTLTSFTWTPKLLHWTDPGGIFQAQWFSYSPEYLPQRSNYPSLQKVGILQF
jgi:hypothetical protein